MCLAVNPRWCLTVAALVMSLTSRAQAADPITLNQTADGYRGIWYMNQPSGDQYAYKYSGGLGTYCAKHRPFAIYCKEAKKTFFCYGGTTQDGERTLLHMVSFFDHQTKTVPRPTILLNKRTDDAHDNPVISIDGTGHIWIFSTSHGTARPSFIHRSARPYDVTEFEQVPAVRIQDGTSTPVTNFSYMQVWHSKQRGFQTFFTRYDDPAKRTIGYSQSNDGMSWGPWLRIAAIEEGHYQISGIGQTKAGTIFNYHPRGRGLNWRTNVYYVETSDNGASWQTVGGEPVSIPIERSQHVSLVHDYQADGLNVYLKDLQFDEHDRPVLLYVTSRGYRAGPENDPRTWMITRWNGQQWLRTKVTTSDNNYDSGELWLLANDDWRIIGPTKTGPQPYNPGGEMVMWRSRDKGANWTRTKQLTRTSRLNHTYARRVLDAHPDFVAIWADGHGRQPSESRLYFSDIEGAVFQLPEKMSQDHVSPLRW